MTDDDRQQAMAWAKSTTDRAVQMFLERGILDTALVEAKPSWGAPPAVLIAMLREQGATQHSYWLIAGDKVPFDYVASSAAKTAREAARHFALKWQLEAARSEGPASSVPQPGSAPANDSAGLQSRAEFLYRLVEDDALWQAQSSGG